jgi:hypothetical protein
MNQSESKTNSSKKIEWSGRQRTASRGEVLGVAMKAPTHAIAVGPMLVPIVPRLSNPQRTEPTSELYAAEPTTVEAGWFVSKIARRRGAVSEASIVGDGWGL